MSVDQDPYTPGFVPAPAPTPPSSTERASAGQTRSMTMIEAIRDALAVMMARDRRVVSFGEAAGYKVQRR